MQCVYVLYVYSVCVLHVRILIVYTYGSYIIILQLFAVREREIFLSPFVRHKLLNLLRYDDNTRLTTVSTAHSQRRTRRQFKGK